VDAKEVRGCGDTERSEAKRGGLTQSGSEYYKPARPLQTGVSLSAPISFASKRKYKVAAHPKRLEVRCFMRWGDGWRGLNEQLVSRVVYGRAMSRSPPRERGLPVRSRRRMSPSPYASEPPPGP
jgi:hypothetical protein